MTPFFCGTAAAKLTVDRSVPIMVVMKSRVIGSTAKFNPARCVSVSS
jgi:hypothetical protein